jgi:hypothetical protein
LGNCKEIILKSGHCGDPGQVSTSAEYHFTLQWTANRISREKGTDPDSSWYLAQDSWADFIFKMYNLKKR